MKEEEVLFIIVLLNILGALGRPFSTRSVAAQLLCSPLGALAPQIIYGVVT